MTKKYRSDIAAAVHEAAKELYDIGLISTKTLRQFDKLCLMQVEPLVAE